MVRGFRVGSSPQPLEVVRELAFRGIGESLSSRIRGFWASMVRGPANRLLRVNGPEFGPEGEGFSGIWPPRVRKLGIWPSRVSGYRSLSLEG